LSVDFARLVVNIFEICIARVFWLHLKAYW